MIEAPQPILTVYENKYPDEHVRFYAMATDIGALQNTIYRLAEENEFLKQKLQGRMN